MPNPETSTSSAKRRLGETSPEPSMSDIMAAIKQTQINFNRQLQCVATKDDINELKNQISSEINELRAENEALRSEVEKLKEERRSDRKELNRLIQQNKSKNLVFRGIPKCENPKQVVEKTCIETLGLQGVKINTAKILIERNQKADILAVFDTVEMTQNVLKNTRKLAGTTIFIEKDLSEEKLQDKKVLLQLKRDIELKDRSHKIIVRNNYIRIGNKWMYYTVDKKLFCGQEEACSVLRALLGNIYKDINFDYYTIFNKIQQKN